MTKSNKAKGNKELSEKKQCVSHDNNMTVQNENNYTDSNLSMIINYRVIALILVNIVPSWDIEGRELASIRRLSQRGTIFTGISAITLLLYSYKY